MSGLQGLTENEIFIKFEDQSTRVLTVLTDHKRIELESLQE